MAVHLTLFWVDVVRIGAGPARIFEAGMHQADARKKLPEVSMLHRLEAAYRFKVIAIEDTSTNSCAIRKAKRPVPEESCAVDHREGGKVSALPCSMALNEEWDASLHRG